MKNHCFAYGDEGTCWAETEGGWSLMRLCGVTAAGEPQWLAGSFTLTVDGARVGDEAVEGTAAEAHADGVALAWRVPSRGLRLESRWTLHAATGVWRRLDRIENTGRSPLTVTRALARFALAPSAYRIYSQGSRWSGENQGAWQDLPHGMLVLECSPGLTAQGATPFLGVCDPVQRRGVAFHLLPEGNWTIRVRAASYDGGPLVVEMGPAADDFRLPLAPGETLELPAVLLHGLPQGEAHLAAPRLQRYALAEVLPPPRLRTPLVYNTWADRADRLDVEHLRAELAAAKEIGCEVFTVDAGWYGADDSNWKLLVGDWREKPTAAFRGRMGAFAAEVRAAGLGFGLWMEPERVSPAAPIVQAHPEWLLPAGGMFRWDIENPAACAYLRSEMVRLLEQYGLAWMKIDFNFSPGGDPTGAGLRGYYRIWHRLLRELRTAYPQTFFEGCAGGGGRLELGTLAQYDGHALSDNGDLADTLRIAEGAWVRLPPGRLTGWASFHEANAAQVDFACRVALAGMLGFSGSLSSLGPQARARVRFHADFFKQERDFLRDAVAHLLTPPSRIGDRLGWRAAQLQDPATTRSLLLAHRLQRTAPREIFRLRDLAPAQAYVITDPDTPGWREMRTGAELMRDGLSIALPGPDQAAMRLVEAQS